MFDSYGCYESFDIFRYTVEDDGIGGIIQSGKTFLYRKLVGRSTVMSAKKQLDLLGFAGGVKWSVYMEAVPLVPLNGEGIFLRLSPGSPEINLKLNTIYKIVHCRNQQDESGQLDHGTVVVELDDARTAQE
jgi:hypothetical protein